MNTAELEKCISLYGRDIYSFCRQLTYSRQDADDLYQDTFLKAVEIVEKLQPDRNPKSYLLSIAVKLWDNKKRKYAWRDRIASMESLTEEKRDLYQDAVCSMEDQVIEKEQAVLIREKVGELADRYRIPVYLYYMEELTIPEIARSLGIPEGTVKSRLFKARKILKARLKACGIVAGKEGCYEG